MRTVKQPTLRWGVSGVPWTHDVEIHKSELGTVDFRSNWCRIDPATWSTPGHDAGRWTLGDHARLAREIIGRGGRFVEVLVDRQPVLGGDSRMEIARAVAMWDARKLRLIFDEVRSVRAAMPAETWGEIFNGDEFGPGCGFDWDPLRMDFWKSIGLAKPSDSSIRSQFTRFANEVAALWGQPLRTIRASSHVYLYPDFRIAHRGSRVQPIVTECGVHEIFMDDGSGVVRLNNALIASGVVWAFWHQPWPGNPGDGASFAAGDKFMYDRVAYDKWRAGGNRAWPEWEGAMLRGAGEALKAVVRA